MSIVSPVSSNLQIPLYDPGDVKDVGRRAGMAMSFAIFDAFKAADIGCNQLRHIKVPCYWLLRG